MPLTGTRLRSGRVVCIGLSALLIRSASVVPTHASARQVVSELSIVASVTLDDTSATMLVRPFEVFQTLEGEYLTTDFSDRNIKVYSEDGDRVGTIGEAGRGPGRFGAVTSAFPVDGLVGAYDFYGSGLVLLSHEGVELSRRALVSDRQFAQPVYLRSLGDGRLLSVYHSGHGKEGGLLRVINLDGEIQAEMMPLNDWYETNTHLVGREGIAADGHDGCIFAAPNRSDTLRAFRLDGTPVGLGVWDSEQPWRSAEDTTGPTPQVTEVIALPGCRALVQVTGWDTDRRDSDFKLAGGVVALFRVDAGSLTRVAQLSLETGGLMGRDASGRGLIVVPPTMPTGNFQLLTVDFRDHRLRGGS